MLHSQTHQGDPDPAAESGEDRFSSGADQLNDVCIDTDCSHCHDNKKLAQFFQRSSDSGRKLEYGSYDGCKNKKQHKERKRFLKTER